VKVVQKYYNMKKFTSEEIESLPNVVISDEGNIQYHSKVTQKEHIYYIDEIGKSASCICGRTIRKV